MPHPLYVPILIAGMLITGRQVAYHYPLQSLPNTPRQLKLAMDKVSRFVKSIRSLLNNHMNTLPLDMQCVERCDDPNPANHVRYEQPVWQSLNMFLGELGCTSHIIPPSSRFSPPIFLRPTHRPIPSSPSF